MFQYFKLRNIIFVGALTLIMFILFYGCIALFEFTIHEEDYVAFSPIMMFQGAPLTHYQNEHPLALSLYHMLARIWGKIILGVIIFVYALAWRYSRKKLTRPFHKVIVSIVFLEVYLCIINILFSVASAFHHVGFGMKCNWQWWECFFTLNIFIGLPVIVVLIALALRRKTFSTVRGTVPHSIMKLSGIVLIILLNINGFVLPDEQISSGNILNYYIPTESVEETKANYRIISSFSIPENVSGADNKSISDIESDWIDWIEANPTHIIMIDLFLLSEGDCANLYYQYNFSKSFNCGLHINWVTGKLDDITSKSWEVYPTFKWYWKGNAPNGGYLYSEMGYLGGYVDVKHTNTHDRLSECGCGFGIGISDFWKGKGSETLAGLARGVDVAFGIMISGKEKEWISNNNRKFEKYATKPTLELKFGIGF
jgi:hypothetical protein